MQNCSLQRRMLLVLIALLFLPVVSAFAVTNTFPVTVVDESDNPVVGATVYAWDTYSYYPVTTNSGVTDNTGFVNVTLGDLQDVSNSLSTPQPNVYFLAIPAQNANPQKLAFGLANTIFYNFYGVDGTSGPVTIKLKTGCELTVNAQISDGTNITTGIVSELRVRLPDVPEDVKAFNFTSLTAPWTIVWPKNSQFQATLSGDANYSDTSKQFYFTTEYFYPQVGNQDTQTINLIHEQKAKGLVTVDLGSESIEFDLYWTTTGLSDNTFDSASVQGFIGSAAIYLPKSTYNMKVAPYGDVGGYSPPVSIFANVVVGDTDVVKNVNITSGSVISGSIALGNGVPISQVSVASYHPVVKIQQEFGTGVWVTIDRDDDVLDGSYAFSRKFANNENYRIVTGDTGNTTFPGIYFNDSGSWYCFSHHVSEPFVLSADNSYSIQMNQAAGIQLQITAPSLDNVLSDLQVAYLPDMNTPHATPIYQGMYEYDFWSKSLFVPFVNVNRDLVVRVDYDEDLSNYENPVCIKVSSPMRGVPGVTTNAVLDIDPLSFVTVSSQIIASETSQVFPGTAFVGFSPVIVSGNNARYPAAEIFGASKDGIAGFDVQMIDYSEQFVFKAEKGRAYRLLAAEDPSRTGLTGFLPYNREFFVPAEQSGDVNQNILIDEGRSFKGVLKIDNGPVISQPVGVMLRPITDSEFYDYNNRERSATIMTEPDGSFRVAGINAGRYQVFIAPGGMIDSSGFGSQVMPMIHREIFVNETDTSYPNNVNPNGTEIVFNLNTSAMGWLDGEVVDEQGQPVVGAMVEIRRPGNDGFRGDLIFACSTDPFGKIVRPVGNEEYPKIPLENGSYDLFVVGTFVKPASYSYQFSDYNTSKPFATVQIYSNNQETRSRIVLKRTFPAFVTVTENGNPVRYMSCQILNNSGQQIGYGYTDYEGKFMVEGLPAGQVQFGISVSSGDTIMFYLESASINPDQDNIIELNLDPNTLARVPLQTIDSNGIPLGGAYGSLFFFSDKNLGFRADHSYITWVQSDPSGRLNLFLPQLSNENSAYGFQGASFWQSSSHMEMESVMYSPPELTYLTVPAETTTNLVWKAPKTVTINATNVPAGKEHLYFGVLMANKKFIAGKQPFSEGHDNYTPGMPGMMEDRHTFFAPYVNGQFVFSSVVPDREYVFLVYEAYRPFDPTYLSWEMYFPAPAVFRHATPSFLVSQDVTRNEALPSLSLMNITCAQNPEIVNRPGAVKIFFTPSKTLTTGNMAWPVIDSSPWEEIPPATYPIQLPEGYALRVVFTPAINEGFLAKTYENFSLTSGSSVLNLILTELPRITGSAFIGANHPLFGQMLLVPDGVDPMSEDFNPIRVPINAGSYTAYLKPGFYRGYVVPAMGYAKYTSFAMGTSTMTLDYNLGTNGHPVSGRVVIASGSEKLALPGAAVIVTRKASATSSLTDGQKMFPYPALMGDYEVPCDPEGRFFFQAENGVDYYLQAVVPAGFSPGKPIKVPASNTVQNFELVVAEGGILAGAINVPAYVEAKPVGSNVIAGQFGTTGSFYADASIPTFDSNGNILHYEFRFVGLDPNMLYDLTFWPMEYGYSYKKMTNISPEAGNIGKVNLTNGYVITGQIVDESGNPLNAAYVSVNLAMTLSTEPVIAGSVRSNYQIRQSVLPTSSDYALQNSMQTGMWTQTNEYGQFRFDNVPQFLLAFIKTENGFSAEGVSYGRTRTLNFEPNFVNDTMHFDIKVPQGGKIIGRLIDDAGKPVTYASIEAILGQEWAYAMAADDGSFSIDGLAPGANYMIHLMEMPGFAPVFRSGVLVQPGLTTDLGSIVVSRAVMAYGNASGTRALMQKSFAYGMPEGVDLGVFAVDGSRALTDDDLLNGRYLQAITGQTNLYIDPMMEEDAEIGFSMHAKPGKNHLGVILHKETADGVRTLVTWGWRAGLTIPTQEQLEFGSFDLSTVASATAFPQKFGSIEGSLKHAVDASATFNVDDAVIALYPVVASGTTYTVLPTPFPTALTSPVNGKWLIKDVPQGSYRIKVITRKYGTIFMAKIINIGDAAVVEELALGTSVVKVSGKVALDTAGNPVVSSAKVSLILRNLSTSTAADGSFAFYLPVNDFFIPQVEVSKPGIKTVRFLDAGGIATSGAKIATDTDLGTLLVSGSVGTVEVTVKSQKPGEDPKTFIGAEVALVYQETASSPWVVGEIQTTDENGLARFLSVPTGKEMTFRARAHYHLPKIATLTVDPVTAAGSKEIIMLPAPPKVFYTGIAELDADNPELLKLRALFDFNQVVVKNDVGLYIGDPNTDKKDECLFPDLIGGRITNMSFNGSVPTPANGDSLIASVTYTGFGNIGRFDIVSNAMFRKEYEVDPLAQDGFTGRQTDDEGNVLPVGIAVPPGYLDPTVDSFNLEVASPSALMQEASLEGSETKPEFAGPTFKFTFGAGESNLGGGTKQEGLFEITIAYAEGTKLEPRWYDTNSKTWSKVGIIQESIKYDYPTKGYVTFKVDHLTDFAVLKNVADAASGMVWDFNNDGGYTTDDVAIFAAWLQTRKSSDKTLVRDRARAILGNTTLEVVYLPINVDDLNADGLITTDDLAIAVAYLQTRKSNDFTVISTRASAIVGNIGNVTPSELPGALTTR